MLSQLAAREPKEQGRPWDGSWGTSEPRRLLPPASPGLRAQAAEAVPSLPPSSPASRVQGVPTTGSENLSGTAHQGAPAAALSHRRGSYLGRDCRQAEGDRGRAGWRGGAATYEAQGFRVGVPAGAALVREAVTSADFGAAPASKRDGKGPGRRS